MAETKEIRELPEYWYIRITDENIGKLSRWRYGNSGTLAGVEGFILSSGTYLYPEDKPAYGELITDEEFDAHILGILPEKWAVERTKENHELINEWFNSNADNGQNYHDYLGTMIFPSSGSMHASFHIPKDYTKIPFSLFKKLVFDPWKELYKLTITREHEAVVIPETLLRDAESALTGERLVFFNRHFNPFRRTMSKSSIQEYYQRFACDGWKDRLEKEFPFLKSQLKIEDIARSANYLFTSFGCSESARVDTEGRIQLPSGWDLKMKDGRFKLEKKPHQMV